MSKAVFRFFKMSSLLKRKNKSESYNMELESIDDPLFSKLHSFKKILSKFNNKTFTYQNTDEELKIQVKLEICKFFDYLLSYNEDLIIDDCMSYFNEFFIPKYKGISNKQMKLLEKDNEFLFFLPHGVDHTKFSKKYKFLKKGLKEMDYVIDKSFAECLLKSLYFTSDFVLQKNLLKLVYKLFSQNEAFVDSLHKIELLLTDENILIYKSINKFVNKLSLSSLNSQVFYFLSINIINGFRIG